MIQLLRAIDRGGQRVQALKRQMAPIVKFHAVPEEAAERYLLHSMLPDEVREYLLHVMECQVCCQALEETRHYIDLVRLAAGPHHEKRVEKPSRARGTHRRAVSGT